MSIERITKVVEEEIAQMEANLAAAKTLLAGLRAGSYGKDTYSIMASASSGIYEGQTVGSALRQFMQSKGGSASLDEIRKALTDGGITWGKYPKRQVKLAIVNSPKIYSLKGETVSLR